MRPSAASGSSAVCPVALSTMNHALKDILSHKAGEVAEAKARVPLEALKERISELGRPRNFFQAVVDRRHPNAKPSKVKRGSLAQASIRTGAGWRGHMVLRMDAMVPITPTSTTGSNRHCTCCPRAPCMPHEHADWSSLRTVRP